MIHHQSRGGHVDKQLQGQGDWHVAIQKIPLKQPEPLRDCVPQPVLSFLWGPFT